MVAGKRVARAIELRQKGKTFAQIARTLKVSDRTVRRWIKGAGTPQRPASYHRAPSFDVHQGDREDCDPCFPEEVEAAIERPSRFRTGFFKRVLLAIFG